MTRSQGFRLILATLMLLSVLAVPDGTATAQTERRGQALPPLPRLQGTTKHPKIDSQLVGVARAFRERGEAAALDEARKRSLQVARSKVRVVAVSRDPDRRGARAAIAAAGGEVEAEIGALVQALLPPSALVRVGEDPAVRFLRPPHRPFPTAVAGEGVEATNADDWHQVGLKGAGEKVAILDVGFKGYKARQASGDLPATVVEKNHCPEGKFDGPDASEHGTAVAEIVHEMAPNAQLYLVCVASEVGLAIGWSVAVSEGARVINSSLAFHNTDRGDGSSEDELGAPASSVALARDAGALWVTSAGNAAQHHWSGKFSDPDGNDWHQFVSQGEGQEGNAIVVEPGKEACVFLKWDDWSSSNQDYDLAALVFIGLAIVPVAASENAQTGSQTPTEWLCVTNAASVPQTYYIAILKANATKTPRFDLFVAHDVGQLEHAVAEGSLDDLGSSPNSMAVGAICWKNDTLMAYSSRGPTIDGRIKPDIAGQSHVSSATPKYGAFESCSANNWSGGFGGTSAAAPHVAGAAAVVRAASEWYETPAKLQSFLQKRAIDLGPSGKDNQFGTGKLWLGNPVGTWLQSGAPEPEIKFKQVKDTLQVDFEGAARVCRDCRIATVQWSFGDGRTSTQNPVRHTYERPGTYRVTFRVTDNVGRSSSASEIVQVR